MCLHKDGVLGMVVQETLAMKDPVFFWVNVCGSCSIRESCGVCRC